MVHWLLDLSMLLLNSLKQVNYILDSYLKNENDCYKGKHWSHQFNILNPIQLNMPFQIGFFVGYRLNCFFPAKKKRIELDSD